MSDRSKGSSREQRPSLKPLTVTIKTALALLGIGRTTIYELMDQGVVETTKIGRRRLVIYSSLELIARGRLKASPRMGSSTEEAECHPRDRQLNSV